MRCEVQLDECHAARAASCNHVEPVGQTRKRQSRRGDSEIACGTQALRDPGLDKLPHELTPPPSSAPPATLREAAHPRPLDTCPQDLPPPLRPPPVLDVASHSQASSGNDTGGQSQLWHLAPLRTINASLVHPHFVSKSPQLSSARAGSRGRKRSATRA